MNIHADIPLIARVSQQIRDMLGEDDDEQAFLDTLDGETDAVDILDRVIAKMQDADALADAIRGQVNDLTARRQRIDARVEAFRATLLTIIDAMGVAKVERPRATISRRSGLPSVRITDEASIPSQLCKVVSSPDKAAIKKQLQAGEVVPGAALETGPDGVTVRVK
jgi:hypothetical protein